MSDISIQVWQDTDDIDNAVCRLLIREGNRTVYQYFDWKEWNAFKQAINRFDMSTNHVNFAPKNNPLTILEVDGKAIDITFGGILAINFYLQGKQRDKIWKLLKNEVNSFNFVSEGVKNGRR